MSAYYVATPSGDDGNSGLSELLPWKTIDPKVNGSSFSAGDSILFKKGCTWREQLTVPSSGTNGSPITFGAYGTGNDPIISGLDTFSASWTAETTAPLVNDTLESGSPAAFWSDYAGSLDTNSLITGVNSWRVDNSDEMLHKSGIAYTFINLQFNLRIDSASSPSTNHQTRWEVVKNHPNYVCMWLNWNGSAYKIGANTSLTTAATDFTLLADTNYAIEIQWRASDGAYYLKVDGSTKSSGTQASITTVSESRIGHDGWNATSFICYVDDVKVYNSDPTASVNRWYTTLATDPGCVLIDGEFGVKKVVYTDAVAAYHWAYVAVSTRLYVYSTDDPAGHTLEYGKRASAVYATGKHHLTFSSLDLRGGTWETAHLENSSGTVSFDSVVSKFSPNDAISFNYDGGLMDGITVTACILGPVGGSGVWIEEAKNVLIEKNAIANIGVYDLDYSNGVQLFGTTCDNITIQDNLILNGGKIRSESVATGYHGGGIHLDTPGTGVVVRRNYVDVCVAANSRGIHFEAVTGGVLEYNIVAHIAGEGISLTTWGTLHVGSNKVYNNVAYACGIGIMSQGAFPLEADCITNNEFKNNILVGNTTRQLSAKWGGENDGTYGSGNLYTYNCLGEEASNFIEWAASTYKSTYDAWETAYGGTTNSVEADPAFTNAAGGDFTLQAGSPCIDAGTDLTSTYQTALMPGSTWVTSILTGNQYNAGQKWECGAYLYPNKRQSLIIVSK